MRSTLESFGFRAVCAADGAEAVGALQERARAL